MYESHARFDGYETPRSLYYFRIDWDHIQLGVLYDARIQLFDNRNYGSRSTSKTYPSSFCEVLQLFQGLNLEEVADPDLELL